eukprot:2249194-Pleurochrysis_carterae.AAC.1
MAACARVNDSEDRARVAEECPGATDSATRPSASAAEGTEAADLLASASKRALYARLEMTAAGESRGELLLKRRQTGKSRGSRGRNIDVEKGFNNTCAKASVSTSLGRRMARSVG